MIVELNIGRTPASATVVAPKTMKIFAVNTSKATLIDLRQYRKIADEEDTRLLYWDKFLEVRNNQIASKELPVPLIPMKNLNGSLAQTISGDNRNFLQSLIYDPKLPSPPSVSDPWWHEVNDGNVKSMTKVLDLTRKKIMKYKDHLNVRRVIVVEEMLYRYHEDPSLCFDLLK